MNTTILITEGGEEKGEQERLKRRCNCFDVAPKTRMNMCSFSVFNLVAPALNDDVDFCVLIINKKTIVKNVFKKKKMELI